MINKNELKSFEPLMDSDKIHQVLIKIRCTNYF